LLVVGFVVGVEIVVTVGLDVVGLDVVGLDDGLTVGLEVVGDIEIVGDKGGLMKKFDTSAATSFIFLALSLAASPIGFPLYREYVLENLWTRVQGAPSGNGLPVH
jgi:hypothetical protein